MGKALHAVVGVIALPMLIAAAAAAWPDFHAMVPVPQHDVLVLKPGDSAFRRIPLLTPNPHPEVAPQDDGTIYVTGDESERYEPVMNVFVASERKWNELELHQPPKLPFSGKSWLVAPHVVFGVADPTDGTPQKLRTAIATNGAWADGPVFPVNELIYDVARLDDGTLAAGVQSRGIWVAGPNEDTFRDLKVDTSLPNGDVWAFGPNALVHLTLDNSDAIHGSRLITRIIDLKTHDVSSGPIESFALGDNVHISDGALPGGGVMVAVSRETQAYNRQKLGLNIGGAVAFLTELTLLTIYFRRAKRQSGSSGLGWAGIGAAAVVLLVAAGLAGLAWLFRGVHW